MKFGIQDALITGLKSIVPSVPAGIVAYTARAIQLGLTENPGVSWIIMILGLLLSFTVWGYTANAVFKWK